MNNRAVNVKRSEPLTIDPTIKAIKIPIRPYPRYNNEIPTTSFIIERAISAIAVSFVLSTEFRMEYKIGARKPRKRSIAT